MAGGQRMSGQTEARSAENQNFGTTPDSTLAKDICEIDIDECPIVPSSCPFHDLIRIEKQYHDSPDFIKSKADSTYNNAKDVLESLVPKLNYLCSKDIFNISHATRSIDLLPVVLALLSVGGIITKDMILSIIEDYLSKAANVIETWGWDFVFEDSNNEIKSRYKVTNKEEIINKFKNGSKDVMIDIIWLFMNVAAKKAEITPVEAGVFGLNTVFSFKPVKLDKTSGFGTTVGLYPPQRLLGYCHLYDYLSNKLGCPINYYKVKFFHNQKYWMVELWMGEYILGNGAEIGIYYKIPPVDENNTFSWNNDYGLVIDTDDFYSAVNDANICQMGFRVFRGKSLNELYECLNIYKEPTFWIVAFNFPPNKEYSVKMMTGYITFPSNVQATQFSKEISRANEDNKKEDGIHARRDKNNSYCGKIEINCTEIHHNARGYHNDGARVYFEWLVDKPRELEA